MAKKKTGNKFLDTGDYGVKKNKAEKQSSSSSSGKNKVEKATTVKNTNKAVKNYSSTNMGGSQYSVKNASNTKKQEQRTTTPKANTNSVNNTVKNHSTTNMGGSQYSVANKVNKDLEQRRQSELDKNKQKREYTNEQMRNQKSGLDSDKKALDTRMTDLTKGTAKQIAGGHLTSLGHDSNDANEFKKSLDQMVLDGKIDQETADKNYESYLKSNTKANRDQDWKDTKLHKTFQKIEQKGIDLNAKGDAQVQKGMEGLKGGKKLLADAYTSGVGMLSDMAFGPAWAGSMMSRSFGNELNSKRGLVESGIITEKEAENNAGLQALKEVGTEYMFTGFGLAKNLKGVGAFTESLDAMKGKALDNLTSKISNKVLKNIAYSGLKGFAGYLEEGVEEIAGGILEPRLSNLAYANKVDKRMENSFREGLLANSSDINTQIDYYVSQGYDRDSIVNAYAEQIMGEENYNDMYNSFLESGMSDKQAKKMATAMQNYMVANLNGDKKAMQKAENEMLAKYNDAFSIKEKFSAKDTFEAAASAMIMASLTGGVGNIGTTAKGMIAKQTFSNVEGAMNAASAISNMAMGLSDEKMAARAKAMYESAQNGNDLALEQYAELQDAIQKQTESDAYDSMIAQMTGTNLANKQRYFAKPQVEMAEDGSFSYIGEVTNQRASDIENKVRESFNQYSEAYGDVQSEDASNLASNITAIELGFINAEAVANFTTNHPEARAIYESVTGVTLPETNQATRDFLFKRSAANYENTARLETINTVDSKKGQLDVQYANSFGSEGQEVFQNLSQNIGLENSTDYVAYATAMGKVYDAGVNGLSMEEAMRLAEDGYAISSEDAELMYKAGATDKTIKKSGGTVKYEVSDAAKIKSSEREAFGALARAFNVNIKVTDNLTTGGEVEEAGVKKSVGQQVNGQYDPKTNTITLNLNKDVRVNVGYTLMHEFTHSIKEHFPSEYDQFAKLFKERWENNVGAEEVARIIKAKQDAYKRVANQDLTKDEALEEIICDQMGEVLHDTEFLNKVAEENPNVAQALLYTIRDILRKIRDLFATYGGFPSKYNGAMLSQLDMLKEAETLLSQAMERASEIKTQEVFDRDSGVRDSVDENPIKYSANPYFEHDVDEWETNGMKDGEVFILGSTGDIIQGLGAMEQDIYMLSDKINIILGDHPEMNIDHIKKISDVLERPVLIMKSTNEGSVNTRLTIFGNEKTSTGPMMVVLDLRPKENKVAIEDMQKAVSAYAKNVDKRGKTAKEFIEESEILFVNKKRIARLLSSLGFARPNEVLLSDSIGRITYRKQNVKIEGEEFNNVFNTSTDSDTKRNSIDTEYFDAIDSGDMDKVRQMVDEAAKRNGYTTKAYHGTDAKFTVFNTKVNNNNRGSHFSPRNDEDSASFHFAYENDRNGKIMSVYLKAENFYETADIYADSNQWTAATMKDLYRDIAENHPDLEEQAWNIMLKLRNSEFAEDYEVFLNDKSGKGYLDIDDDAFNDKEDAILTEALWELVDLGGYDGLSYWNDLESDGEMDYVIRDPERIKSADPITYDDNGNIIPLSERFDETKDDIRWSVDSNEADAQGRTLSQGQAEFYKNVAPELRDEDGNIKRYYHGTQRMDRVGNIFDPARATSGPMAFFTDNPEIAENYSKSKSDTSLKYDDNAYFMYEDQFRTKSEDDEDTMSIIDVWRYLPKSDRDYITERAGHTHYDWDDYETLVYDEETNDAGGGFTWQLKEARGNTLKALVEQWLNSGNLFNEEAKFNDVLDFIGVNEVLKKNGYEEVTYFDPNYTEEGVFEQYLRVENPLVTTNIDEEFVDDLVDWLDATDLTIYERESASTDFWDKNDVDPYDFAERVRDDIEKGTTHAWTSIPDAVTDFLKDQGFDGIVDEGGKHGGLGHQVVIPFSSEQVKDVDNLNPTDNPDKRFSITENMSPEERYEELKDKTMYVVESFKKDLPLMSEELNILRSKKVSLAKKEAVKLAKDLGVAGVYSTNDIDFDFEFSNRGINESGQKQQFSSDGDRYVNFVNLMMNLDSVIDNAQLIEKHDEDYYIENYDSNHRKNKNLKYTYVLASCLMDEESIVPIKLTIMEYNGGATPKVHVAIATNSIKKSRVKVTPANSMNLLGVATSIYELKLSQLLGLVNDKALVKYIPQQFRDEVEYFDETTPDKRYSVDSEGNELSPGQTSFFGDSAIRDKDGNLKVMYHGTNAKFTVFDWMKGGQTGRAEGFGFYFTDSKETAMSYGTKLMPVYLNIKKPLTDESTIKRKDFAKLIKATIELEADRYEMDIKDTWISNYVDTYYNNPSIDECCDKVAKQILFYSTDRGAIEEVIAGMGIREYNSYLSKVHDLVTDILGFDGLVTDWYGNGVSAEVVLAWRPEQVKDILNDNPTNDVDIRYSIDSEGNELSEQQTKFFFNSKVRDALGRLKVFYHGTTSGGFTIFDPMQSDDHRSLFLTDNRQVAMTYIEDDLINEEERQKFVTNPIADHLKVPKNETMVIYGPEYFRNMLNQLDEEDSSYAENFKSLNTKLSEIEAVDNGVGVQFGNGDIEVYDIYQLASELSNKYVDKNYSGMLAPTYDELPNKLQGTISNPEWTTFDSDGIKQLILDALGQGNLTGDIYDSIPNYTMDQTSNKTGVYPCYVNLENPLIVDADGSNWNLIVPKGYDAYKLDFYEWDGKWELTLQKAEGKSSLEDYQEYYEPIIDFERFETEEDGIETIREVLGDVFVKEYLDEVKGGDRFIYNPKANQMMDEPGTANNFRETTASTRSISEWAYNNGYDGVIFENLIDVGQGNYGYMEASTIVVAFKPEQIKLIDNTEPTSDPDIRFSTPTQDELDDRQMNNPKDDMFLDGDISDEMKARRVKIQDEIAAELAHIIRKDVQYTHGKTLEVKSIKPQITELVRSTMANSENTNKEKRETTKMVMEAAQVLWRRYGTKRDAEGTLILKRSELAELQRFAMDVSKDVVENTNYIDDSIYNEYQTMRDYIRSIRIEVPDRVKSDIDFSAYRRKNLGRMTLVNEHHGGTAIDVLWDDMKPVIASFVSEEFDLEEIDTQAEMFLAIESALDNTKAYRDAYASEFAQDLEMQFAKDFLNIVLTEGQAWKSFADKKQDYYNERTKQMKARHKEAMREQRMKFQKEIKEVKASEREKRNIQRMKYLQKEAERKQKAREQRQAKKEHKERMRSWKSIGRNYDALVKKLNHPKKELGANIPEELREALATVLKSFDLQTENSVKIEFKTGKVAKTTLAMRDLRDALSKIAPEDDSGVFLHNGAMFGAMEILVRDLNDRPLRDLNNSELDEIDVLLASIKHAIDNENKLLVKGQKESQRSAGETIIREFQEKIAKYGRGYNYTGARGKIHNLLNTSMLTPGAFFKSLGGQMKQMYKNLRYAQDDYIRDVNYLRGFFGDLFKPYQNKKKPGSAIEDWQNDKMAQTITLRNGSVIKMTVAQMMSLYCLSKRPQAMEHMITENGGVGIILADVTSTKGVDKVLGQKQTGTVSATAISYDDVVSIAGMLTKEQKHIADELQKLMNGRLQEWGNETSMQLYGIKLFTEDNYFPIEVSSGHLDSQIGKASGIKGNKISNFGFTKPLVEHPNNPIVIGDIFDIVADHANKMALYHSYAAALTDFNRVLNYKSEENPGVTVKSALQEAYGHDAMSFIDNLLSDINGQAEARMDGVNDLYNTALANYKKAAIGANLRVLVQQPTAIVRSLSMIDAKYFVGIPKNLIKERNEMHEHCPIAAWKAWGNYQNDYTRSLSDIMFNKDWNRFDTVTMGMYGYADDMTWAIIWGAVKNEVKAKHPGVKEGSEEFWILCNERASEVFDDTQVVDSVFHRSDAMRQKGVTKIFTAFMAEPTKTYNMMRSQIVESYRMYQDGDKQGAARGLAKVTTVLILNAAAVSAAAAVIDAMRGKGDDDEDETWVETFLRNFWENFYGLGSNSDPLAMIVFCKDIENLFINAMDGNLFGGTQNMALEGWWKLAQGCAEFKNKVMTGEESFWAWMFGDPEKNTPGKFLSGLGYVTGIPTYTLVKDLKTVLNKFGLQVYAGDETETETKKADKKESRWFDYNRNPIYIQDGSGFDNFLNRFGYNLTEDEKAERQYNKALKDYKKQVKNLSGEEKDKKVRELATSGYKDAITEGDYDTIRRMRQMVSDLGGDVDDFDEKVSKATVTAYKKCIGGDADDTRRMIQMRNYLLDQGWSEYKISSDIVYKSDAAREFKAACRSMDKEKMVETLRPLAAAGLTKDDAYKLYKNRNMGNFDKSTTGKLKWATEGTISSDYGYRNCPYHGYEMHEAIDIAAPLGTTVTASDGGTVIFAGYDGSGYGNYIRVQHANGVITQYSHLDYIDVRKGQNVGQGQYIGNVGSTGNSTGPHLDFRVEVNGQFVNPHDYLS